MLRYGFHKEAEKYFLATTVDDAFLEEVDRQNPNFHTDLATAEDLGVVRAIEGDKTRVLAFDFPAVYRKRNLERRREAARTITGTLVRICNTHTSEGDERLEVGIGSEKFAEGRLQMYADITMPELPDDVLAAITTTRMREFARDIRYEAYNGRKPQVDWVYAQVNRQLGVTIQTNHILSAAIETDGMEYERGSSYVELGAHNIYTRSQQFICLAGAVALAHADELVTV